MRILPLVRFGNGNDDSPIRLWEILFVPIMLPIFIVILMIAGLASFPLSAYHHRRSQRQEKALRALLTHRGRFLPWSEVESKFQSGTGTLIIEFYMPKGPIYEWWTPDDIIASAPIPLAKSQWTLPEGDDRIALDNYSASFISRYLDHETGTAILTEVPGLPWIRNLTERHPESAVVSVLRMEKPIVYAGDPDAALAGPDSDSANGLDVREMRDE